jgi:hypothetical protein
LSQPAERSELRNGLVPVALCLLFGAITATAQTRARITAPVNDSTRISISGSVHRLARPEFDRGPVDPGLRMEKMILMLDPGPAVESDLRAFIDRLHTAGSADFHRWLTPDEFGRRYGAAPEDISKITSWLTAQGFQVGSVARGGRTLQFSGAARQVDAAFRAEMHRYRVRGEDHIANSREISVPAALAPVVKGVASLNDFFSTPIARGGSEVRSHAIERPAAILNTNNGLLNFLAPGDFAKVYNVSPLYQSSLNGSGQTIAILAKSDFLLSDYANFRTVFNLPATAPSVVLAGADPGSDDAGNFGEATLDPQWAGGVAPGAAIEVVTAATTATTDGINLAALYAVEENAASVISVSFEICEPQAGAATSAFFNATWAQAAAQGISVVVSAGDSGAAGCDAPNDPTNGVALGGPAVNAIASTPYNTAVGGSQFNEAAAGGNATFWNANNGAAFTSALGYIPEAVWNESCNPTTPGSACASQGSFFAGPGGASAFYSKPVWQSTSITGVPSDGKRDLPDISFSAALHDGYLVCESQSCQNTGSPGFYAFEGTSASAPAFAGIVAIIDQKLGGRQGLANYALYALAAAENFPNCNSSNRTNPANPPSAQCPFNDITVGNNNVPGQTGSSAGVGYDLASGLGSVNASVLANTWQTFAAGLRSTHTTLGAKIAGQPVSSINITHGQAVELIATVAPQSGGGTPTGVVAVETGGGFGVTPGALSGGAVDKSVTNLPGGSYNILANYSGDSAFAASASNQIAVTVSPEKSATTIGVMPMSPPVIPDFSEGGIPANALAAFGSPALLHAHVAGNSGAGVPSGTIAFFDQGLQIGAVPLNSAGDAELDLCFNPGVNCPNGGMHYYTAAYSGDSSFNASPSGMSTLMVTMTAPDAYQVGYAANLGSGDSFVDLTNTGASNGNLCVNVYAFDAAEEMVSCCSCLVTPNALTSLSVKKSLLSSTLTGVTPTSASIALLATAGGSSAASCDPSAAAVTSLASGLRAFGTTLHALSSQPGSYAIAERPFIISGLSISELRTLTATCAFIQSDGSGSGICGGCTAGGQ